MIPVEAVEAAAISITEMRMDGYEHTPQEYARAALKAAMPYILQHFANSVDWRCTNCEDPIDHDAALKKLRAAD